MTPPGWPSLYLQCTSPMEDIFWDDPYSLPGCSEGKQGYIISISTCSQIWCLFFLWKHTFSYEKHIRWFSGLLSDDSRWWLIDPIKYWGSNLSKLYAKQKPYPLHYLTGPGEQICRKEQIKCGKDGKVLIKEKRWWLQLRLKMRILECILL